MKLDTSTVAEDFFDDEYDPLAPLKSQVGDVVAPEKVMTLGLEPADGEVPAAEEVVTESEEPSQLEFWGSEAFAGEEAETAEPKERIFVDSAKVLRLKFDEDFRLEKVRLSNIWFQKLSQNRRLSTCFNEVLVEVRRNLQFPPAPEPLEISLGQLPTIDETSVNEYAAMLNDVEQRWKAANETVVAQLESQKNVLKKCEGVTVELDPTGQILSVDFDEQWLERAQVGTICSQVLKTAQAAYREFDARPKPDREELNSFAQVHSALLSGIQKWMESKG